MAECTSLMRGDFVPAAPPLRDSLAESASRNKRLGRFRFVRAGTSLRSCSRRGDFVPAAPPLRRRRLWGEALESPLKERARGRRASLDKISSRLACEPISLEPQSSE